MKVIETKSHKKVQSFPLTFSGLSQTRKGWWKNRILLLETYDWIQNNQTYQQEIFKSLDYFCLVFN